MKLLLVRNGFTSESTTGELYINGRFECFTLEDMVREVRGQPVESWKVPGKTAIPYGTYDITVDFSNRFQTRLPRLLNVMGYTGIRMHPGNDHEDTDGCILVGQSRNANFISRSRAAMDHLLPRLENAIAQQERVFIEISRG